LRHVGQRLGDDEVRRGLDGRGQPLDHAGHVDGDAQREVVRELLHRRREPALDQGWRHDPVDERPQGDGGLVDVVREARCQAAALLVLRLLRQAVGLHRQAHQGHLEPVVEVARDPPSLLVALLEQPGRGVQQRPAAVRHLLQQPVALDGDRRHPGHGGHRCRVVAEPWVVEQDADVLLAHLDPHHRAVVLCLRQGGVPPCTSR
jgi:hypothetical protein